MKKKKRKKKIAKKIVLLLSISLAMAMNGIPMSVNGSTGTEENADYTESTDGTYKVDGKSTSATGDIVAEVTIDGKTEPFTDFKQAWQAMRGKKAKIHLRQNIDMTTIEMDNGYNGDKYDQAHTLFVYPEDDITLSMDANIKIFSNNEYNSNPIIQVMGGTFTLESGQICCEHNTVQANALVITGGNVFIKDSTSVPTVIKSKNAPAISVSSSEKVSISGGTIESDIDQAIRCDNGLKISQILANGYAFYDTTNLGWVNDMDQNGTTSTVKKVKTKKYPVTFREQPESQSIIQYGKEIPTLHATATRDPNANSGEGEKIAYQWYKSTEKGTDEPIEGAKGSDYKPNQRNAGTYEYYCRATCDNWFPLDSDHAIVTIEKKPLEAAFQDEIVKTYDSTADVVNPSDIPPIHLKGIIEGDTVTASAIKAVFPSTEPGYYDKIKVTLSELAGADADNYTIENPIMAKGQIIPLSMKGIALNPNSLSLSVGGSAQLIVTFSPEQGIDKTVTWTSSNPAVANVDQNGKVTAVGPGSAVITVTTKDGNFKASCNITADSSSGGGSGGWWNPGTNFTPPRPFLKDSPAKQGWNLICEEAAKAAAFGKGTLTIHMNGTVLVPDSFLSAIRGSEVTAVLEMGGGIAWNIYGKDISEEISRETNLSVKQHSGTIPKELIESTAGGLSHLELSFVHDGAFGFTATLTARLIKDGDGFIFSNRTGNGYTGMYANLYSYHPTLHKLEFICADMIREDGTVNLPFTQASDYTLILSASPMGGADAPETPEETEPDQPQEPEKNIHVQAKMVRLSKTLYTYSGKAKKPSVTATDTDGNPISRKYYTVSYKDNKNVGKAMAVVVFKDGYTGTVKKAFTIRPSKTAIKKITGASFGFTVKWAKKSAQTSGYQIQYSANAGFKEANTHSIYVKKASVTKKPVKKLKAGKKYYVRIRTYKTVTSGGKSTKIFSAWSKAGTVKTL